MSTRNATGDEEIKFEYSRLKSRKDIQMKIFTWEF